MATTWNINANINGVGGGVGNYPAQPGFHPGYNAGGPWNDDRYWDERRQDRQRMEQLIKIEMLRSNLEKYVLSDNVVSGSGMTRIELFGGDYKTSQSTPPPKDSCLSVADFERIERTFNAKLMTYQTTIKKAKDCTIAFACTLPIFPVSIPLYMYSDKKFEQSVSDLMAFVRDVKAVTDSIALSVPGARIEVGLDPHQFSASFTSPGVFATGVYYHHVRVILTMPVGLDMPNQAINRTPIQYEHGGNVEPAAAVPMAIGTQAPY